MLHKEQNAEMCDTIGLIVVIQPGQQQKNSKSLKQPLEFIKLLKLFKPYLGHRPIIIPETTQPAILYKPLIT